MKAPLQCRVFFDVLAVLIQSRSSDTVQLASGQSRFKHVARIHCPIGLASTNHGVQLVNKQNDVAFLLGEIIQHRLEALFKFTTVLGTSNERAQIQGQYPLIFEAVGYLAVHNALSQTLNDGGFAHAWLANQHRVVFGTPLQYLHRATNLLIATDNRI